MSDEIVDGPRQAARILNAMPEKERRRLLARIEIQSPDIFKAITENLLSFEDLRDLTEKSVQILVRAVDQRALVIALAYADSELTDYFLDNMSDRMSRYVREELDYLQAVTPAEIENAKQLIVTKADELRTTGILRSHASDDVWV